MERLAPSGISAALGPAYLANLTATVNYITSKGAYAVLDPHNFGRFNGAIISDVASFKTFWTNLATQFKGNSKVVSKHLTLIVFTFHHGLLLMTVYVSRSSTPTTNTTTWTKPSS